MHGLLHKKDFYAGILVTTFGAAVVYGAMQLSLGSLMHMGPGMFPFILGISTTITGFLLLLSSIVTPAVEGETIMSGRMEWRGWICILAGPIMFMIFGQFFGMAPAIFMCVFVSALGDRTATLKSSFVLAVCVTVVGSVLFSYVLQVSLQLFKWGH